MDSGNSGSMNSSSGDDQEYDSRPESIPSFLNNPSITHHHFNPISSNPHLSSHHQNHPPQSLFNPPSNYLEPFSTQSPSSSSHLNPNSLSNLDVIWSRGLIGSSSGGGGGGGGGGVQGVPSSTNTHQISFPSSSDGHGHGHAVRPSSSSAAATDQTSNVVNRNSKKRTRASRRAPTTVLTTDTSNFRAMVQEFTGIPAPPFSATSLPTYSRRFDLFGNTSGSGLGSLGPLYPLRPSAQKIINNQQHQQTPFPSSSSSSLSPSLLNNNSTNSITSSSMAAAAASASNNPLSSFSSSSFLNMQNNPILTFQSLLQSPVPPSSSLKYPLGDGAVFGTKSPLEELGMSSHGHMNANLSGFHSHAIASDGTALRSENNVTTTTTTTTTTNWRDGTAGNNNNHHHHHHHQDHLRPLINDDNFDHHRGISSGFKLSASSSDFHHPEKGLENVSSRGEGAAVESWICPSD